MRSIVLVSARTWAGLTSARKRVITHGPNTTGAAAAPATNGIHSQRAAVTARKMRAIPTPAHAARENVGTTQSRPRPMASAHHVRRASPPTADCAAATGIAAARKAPM